MLHSDWSVFSDLPWCDKTFHILPYREGLYRTSSTCPVLLKSLCTSVPPTLPWFPTTKNRVAPTMPSPISSKIGWSSQVALLWFERRHLLHPLFPLPIRQGHLAHQQEWILSHQLRPPPTLLVLSSSLVLLIALESIAWLFPAVSRLLLVHVSPSLPRHGSHCWTNCRQRRSHLKVYRIGVYLLINAVCFFFTAGTFLSSIPWSWASCPPTLTSAKNYSVVNVCRYHWSLHHWWNRPLHLQAPLQ